jgi:hypothetical protein
MDGMDDLLKENLFFLPIILHLPEPDLVTLHREAVLPAIC